MRRIFSMVILLISPWSVFAAGKFPAPLSYTKPVGSEFLFVQLGDPAEEEKNGTPEQRLKFQELRATYLKPGLYRVSDRSLVWELPTDEFTPYDLAFLSDDGQTLIRVDGEFWRTEPFPGGIRPSVEKQQQQLNGSAIRFYQQGKLVTQIQLSELISDAEVLKHTPEHLIWYASARLNPSTGKFILFTQEPRRFSYNSTTGELLEVRDVGLANPLMVTILSIAGVMSGIILVGWLVFVARNRKPAVSHAQ